MRVTPIRYGRAVKMLSSGTFEELYAADSVVSKHLPSSLPILDVARGLSMPRTFDITH
jgi:hypothetical protein